MPTTSVKRFADHMRDREKIDPVSLLQSGSRGWRGRPTRDQETKGAAEAVVAVEDW